MYGNSDPDQRRSELQLELARLDNPVSSVLRQRLASAHPTHIARVARGLFLTLTIGCALTLILSLVLPHLGDGPRSILYDIERALPIDLPVLAGILALCMLVSWVTSGQAALAIGRDCPLLPWEEEAKRRLLGELELITGGSASNLVGFGSGRSSDSSLQMPGSSLASGGTNYARSYDAVDMTAPHQGSRSALQRLTDTPPATPGGTLVYGQGQERGASKTPAHGSSYPTPASVGRATPAPYGTAAPAGRGFTPGLATPAPSHYSPAPAARTPPGLSYRAPHASLESTNPTEPAMYERAHHSGYTITTHDNDSRHDQRQPASWNMPGWTEVDEPWLQDALKKAATLTRRYPVQAFLEFSVEPDLPFTLVLERATPAMAVRAMVDYVGFLASIATPRRARIELRSVVHLDRSFYRSVMSAMEPYFPDSVEINQQGYRVEIQFLEPDSGWARHPLLPMD
jgi:hypothetical protein